MAKKEEKTKKPVKKAEKKVEKKPIAKTAVKTEKKPVKKVVAPVKKVAAPVEKKIETPKAAKKISSDNFNNNDQDKVLLTEEGLQKLKEELAYLEDTKRDEVAKRLQEAISYGDLSENAEYEEAKNEQAFCEGRIAELKKMIKNVEIIDEKNAHKAQAVRIGTTVVIKNLTKDEEGEEEYTIVGSTEANPFSARISNESPIGKAILGKKKGDIVLVNAPGGDYEFRIVNLK